MAKINRSSKKNFLKVLPEDGVNEGRKESLLANFQTRARRTLLEEGFHKLLAADCSVMASLSRDLDKKWPESPSIDTPRAAPRLENLLLAAVLGTPAMKGERAFLENLPAETIFSYRVNIRDKFYNVVIAKALKMLLDRREAAEARECCHFVSCRDFIASPEREGGPRNGYRSCYDYNDLIDSLGVHILCLEDLDLLPLLPEKDFCMFLGFLKKYAYGNRFFLFGDFGSFTATLSARAKELELALNIRDFDARQIFVDELCIARGMIKIAGVHISADAEKTFAQAWNYFRRQRQDEHVADVMRVFVEKTKFAVFSGGSQRAVRADTFGWLGIPKTAKRRAVNACRPTALQELDSLVGMNEVKAKIERIVAHALVSEEKAAAGLTVKPHNLSYLFLGNPGTGKTTVARILAETLREIGVLKKGHLVAAHRGTLVAPYTGQTAPLVTETFISALDGVLFVDEAYALYTADQSLDSYGKEALNTLTLLMSEYAGRIAVIFAGYPKEMNYMLQSVNPGLRERFVHKITFADYAEDEMWEIFSNKLRGAKLVLEEAGAEFVRHKIANIHKNKGEQFANARVIDNLFQELLQIQETRLASGFYRGLRASASKLKRLTVEDCEELLESEIGQPLQEERRPVGF